MAGITSVLTVGGTAYAGVDRANARVKLNELSLKLSGEYDSLAFHETSRSPVPTWNEWTALSLAMDVSDGNGSLTRFSGVIGDTQTQGTPKGWQHAYTAFGLRFLADKLVPIEAPDQTGSITYNRPPGDSYYLPTDSGLDVGTMFARLLTIGNTVARFSALGVGGYSSGGSGATGIVTMSGTAIGTVTLGVGGGGYTTAPLVFVSGGGMISPATVTASVSGGAVTGYTVGAGGHYTGTPTVVVTTLPAATTADLVKLNVVPVSPVCFLGKNLFNTYEQILSRWMPRFVVQLKPDGTIRFKDTTSVGSGSGYTFAARTITLPSALATGGDPVVNFPRIRRSSSDCATNLVLRGGPEVETAILTLTDGTLAEVFSSSDKSSWTYYNYSQPQGATDVGTVTTMTSTSATLQSDTGTRTWAANFWSGIDATVYLINTLASLISETETRTVTSNGALAAGGTATVSWDTGWPTSSAAYTRYRIVGTTTGLIDTWRTYQPREPHTGATGLNTFIGAHLVKKSPTIVSWGNATTTVSGYYTQALVVSGSVPVSLPASVDPVPSQGIFRFTQPTVTYGGQIAKLKTGSPTTVADGVPVDVQIKAIYSRGALTAVQPPDVGGAHTYSGTAAAFMSVTEYMDFPSWIWKNDSASMTTLANEHLVTMNNIVYDLEIEWDVDHTGTVPAWSFLDFDSSLNIAIAGSTSPWSAINAPIKGITVRWNTDGSMLPGIHQIGFTASTRRRPFTGDDLYLHPQFAQGTPLGNMDGAGGLYGTGMMAQGYSSLGDVLGAAQNFASDNLAASGQMAQNAMSEGDAFGRSIGMDGPQGTVATSEQRAAQHEAAVRESSPEARIERGHERNEAKTEERRQRMLDKDAEGMRRHEAAQENSPEARIQRAQDKREDAAYDELTGAD